MGYFRQGWGKYWTYEYKYWKIITQVVFECNVFSILMFFILGKTSTRVVLAPALILGALVAIVFCLALDLRKCYSLNEWNDHFDQTVHYFVQFWSVLDSFGRQKLVKTGFIQFFPFWPEETGFGRKKPNPALRYILSNVWVRFKHILSVIHYTIHGAVCLQFTHSPCDDWENMIYFVLSSSSNRKYELQ